MNNRLTKRYKNGIPYLPICKEKVAEKNKAITHLGQWNKSYRSGAIVTGGWVSSVCDMWNERRTEFCPHCGTEMDLEEEYA